MDWSLLRKAVIWLGICILVIFAVKDAHADKPISSDTLKVYFLGEIVVTARRTPATLISALKEIDSEKMEKEGILNIAQAVELTPGAYVSIGSRNEMMVQLRGIEQRQISVMLDGVPIYVPYDGLVDLGQIPISALNKITVTEGNASVLYGPNSLGGSVNILTSIPVRRNSKFRFFGGSGKMFAYSLQQSFSLENFGILLSAGQQRQDYFPLSDDFESNEIEDGKERENSYYLKRDFFGKINFRSHPDHHTALSFSYIDNEKGVPPDIYAQRPRYWKFPVWRKWVLNLSSSQKISDKVLGKVTVFYDKYDNTLDSYDDNTYTTQTKGYAFHSTYDDYSTGSNIFLTHKLSQKSELTLGLNYKRDVHREQDDYEELREKYEMDTYTLGVEFDHIPLDRLATSGGVSVNVEHPTYANDQPLRRDIEVVNGRFGVHYQASSDFEIFGSFAHKTRFPTLKELYSGYSGRNVPNPDLKEESAYNFETGLGYTFSPENRAELVLFNSEITNLIVEKIILVDDEEKNQLDNIGKASTLGAELSVNLRPEKNTIISGSYTFLKAKNLSDDRVSDKLEFRPEHRARLGVEYNFEFGLALNLIGNYVGERSYLDDQGQDHGMPDYTIIDGRVRQSLWEHLVLVFESKNILDKDYQTEYGFPMPGRTLGAGMEIEF
jgi:iron complex outermembrane receptor protein